MDLLPPDPCMAAHNERLERWIDRLTEEFRKVVKQRPQTCSDPRCDGLRTVVEEIHREASPFTVLLLAEILVTQPELRWLRHFVGHTFTNIEFPRNAAMKNAADRN